MNRCIKGGRWLAALVLLVISAWGCAKNAPQGHYQPPPSGRPQRDVVTGIVLFEDAPVMAGRVELYDDQGQVIAQSPILSDGTFQMLYVPAGLYKVAVKTSDLPVDENLKLPQQTLPQPTHKGPLAGPPDGHRRLPPGMDDMRPPTPALPALTKELKAKYERIDPKYEDPAKSGITCSVVKGPTMLEPWKLQATTP